MPATRPWKRRRRRTEAASPISAPPSSDETGVKVSTLPS
jgi:hypothetical protein